MTVRNITEADRLSLQAMAEVYWREIFLAPPVVNEIGAKRVSLRARIAAVAFWRM